MLRHFIYLNGNIESNVSFLVINFITKRDTSQWKVGNREKIFHFLLDGSMSIHFLYKGSLNMRQVLERRETGDDVHAILLFTIGK